MPHVPRLVRYSLAEKINLLFIEVIELILTAGYATKEQKIPIIQKASIKLDSLKFFIQLAWEMKAFDTKQFTKLSTPLVTVGKMLGGWQKQSLNETPSRQGRS